MNIFRQGDVKIQLVKNADISELKEKKDFNFFYFMKKKMKYTDTLKSGKN